MNLFIQIKMIQYNIINFSIYDLNGQVCLIGPGITERNISGIFSTSQRTFINNKSFLHKETNKNNPMWKKVEETKYSEY